MQRWPTKTDRVGNCGPVGLGGEGVGPVCGDDEVGGGVEGEAVVQGPIGGQHVEGQGGQVGLGYQGMGELKGINNKK